MVSVKSETFYKKNLKILAYFFLAVYIEQVTKSHRREKGDN